MAMACIVDNCTNIVLFGANNSEKVKVRCYIHKLYNDITIMPKCNECDNPAKFFFGNDTYSNIISGVFNGTVPIACYIHVKYGYLPIKIHKCYHSKCERSVMYGLKQTFPISCIVHKNNDMINLKTTISSVSECSTLYCGNRATYSLKDDPPMWCKFCSVNYIGVEYKHYKQCAMCNVGIGTQKRKNSSYEDDGDMICEIHNSKYYDRKLKCVESMCYLSPKYYNSESKPVCALHAKSTKKMIYTDNYICKEKSCISIATHADISNIDPVDKIIPTHCNVHKTVMMVNLSSENCLFCDNVATIMFIHDKKPILCINHSSDIDSDTILDLKTVNCQYCDQRAIYGINGDIIPITCAFHASEDLVICPKNVCIITGCYNRAIYRSLFHSSVLCCEIHKTDSMVNLKSNICIYKDCKLESNYSIYCEHHTVTGFLSNHKKCSVIDCLEFTQNGIFCTQHK